jgi:thioredoxin reductase (NADPH)
VRYNEAVHKIHQEKNEQKFIVHTDNNIFESKIIVIAVGILGKPNKPDYKIPATLSDKVLFDVTSKDISDSKVLVIGGGDSASEYCQYLVQKNNKVTLSYRKTEFTRMNDINKASLMELDAENKVTLELGSDIISIEDENTKPKINSSNHASEVFDFVVYALGGSTPENFLKLIGIDFDGPNPINSSNSEMKRICENYLECSL